MNCFQYNRFHSLTCSPNLNPPFHFSSFNPSNHSPNSRVLVCAKRNTSMEINDDTRVVVGDNASLQKKIAAICEASHSKLQVIADFDGTLTKYNINGQRGHTSHGLLQQGNIEYDIKRQKLYDHYRPLEICPSIPVEEKSKLMEEWWEKTHALIVEGGLTYDDIKKSVTNSRIAFRDGVIQLFELLEEKGVPILIFSAGLADIIEEVLKQKLHKSFKNIEIVSNRMVFDDDGRLVRFKGKTIHVLNKNEHALYMGTVDGPALDFSAMTKRTNVLLLGDHTGDLGMSDGLDYETRISVGFLNDKVDESLDGFCKAFDIVYLNDGPMSGVVKLASQLIGVE